MLDSKEVDLFIEKYEKFKKSQTNGFISLVLCFVVLYLSLFISSSFRNLISDVLAFFVAILFIAGFMSSIFHISKIQESITPSNELTYELCKVYKEISKIGKGKLSKEKIEEVSQELVKGPINRIQSTITESKDKRTLDIFSIKNLSLLEKTRMSLMNQIYPIIKKGEYKLISKAEKYLLPIIITRIENDFDGYEAALDKLEKGLPTKKIEIPEMITNFDKMKNWFSVKYSMLKRNLFLMFITLSSVIGLICIILSFFIKIDAGTAFLTTITAASVLAATAARHR